MPQATIHIGDCIDRMRELPADSVHSCVTDPPYGLSFMGKQWDYDVPSIEVWTEVLRVLKPGGHLLAFGGSRTFHRMAVAIEDAGFEMRDTVMWLYGSGFPKSLDVSKAIDREAGAEREVVGRYQPPGMDKPWNLQNAKDDRKVDVFASSRNNLDVTAPATAEAAEWEGWGTTLKPAHEPIILARRPFSSTVAGNVQEHGAGALNVDGCRVPVENGGLGRWPANVIHDGSEEVEAAFPDSPGQQGDIRGTEPSGTTKHAYGEYPQRTFTPARLDEGSASRFFYCAKAAPSERGDYNDHPTVKPLSLMQWLVRLVTPRDGTVLDPFMGSGSTGIAALGQGYTFIGCEREDYYAKIAERRIREAAPLINQVRIAA